MARVEPLELAAVNTGTALAFRDTINNNFSAIMAYFENFQNDTTEVVVSANRPDSLAVGSLWYQILD